MAPICPDEVDVFTVPHSRMKQLVHKYLDMVSSTNFRDVGRMTSVLEKLCHTFHEFKTHEQIENRLIMKRLKEKLTALSITDTAVCNCHSDNRLTEMLSLVLEGYRWAQGSEQDRVKYGLRLRNALEDFTQVFLPHMKEEEEVFQPMLIEYFTYEELKELKAKVIQKHQEKAEETEKADIPAEDDKTEEPEQDCHTSALPDEVMLNVMSYLSPRDLARCAQVSRRWNQLALDPSIWPAIYPVQWAAGNWTFHPEVEEEEEAGEGTCGEEEFGGFLHIDDEDADIDESSDSEGSDSEADASLQQALREVKIISGLVRHVLKRVGAGVRVCNLAHSRGLSSSLVHKILKLCPNLHTLVLAHTKITDAAFKEYGMKGGLGLEYLDLTACENITDTTLHSLTGFSTSSRITSGGSCSLSGSERGTEQNRETVARICCGNKMKNLPCGKTPDFPVCQIIPELQPESSESGYSEVHTLEPSFLETECLIERDLSLTDLTVALQLCDFGCVGQITDSERPECLGQSRLMFCCQTRDIYCSGTDKNNTAKQEKKCCSKEQKDNGTKCVPRTNCSGSVVKGVEAECDKGQTDPPHALHQLRFLSLNGCFQIQDDGLRVLSERGGLPSLRHLDLSGCLNLTGAGVKTLVAACPSLDHASLFYCDNLDPDPFPTTASGCRNLQCSARVCCRSGE